MNKYLNNDPRDVLRVEGEDGWYVVVERSDVTTDEPLPPLVIGPYADEDDAESELQSDGGQVYALVTEDAWVADETYRTQSPPEGERLAVERWQTDPGDTPVTCVSCGEVVPFSAVKYGAPKCPEGVGASGVRYGHRIPREEYDRLDES